MAHVVVYGSAANELYAVVDVLDDVSDVPAEARAKRLTFSGSLACAAPRLEDRPRINDAPEDEVRAIDTPVQ